MLYCTVQIHHTGRKYRHERTERKDIFKTFANIRAWMPPTHESGGCAGIVPRTVSYNLSRHTGCSLAPQAILPQARLSADTLVPPTTRSPLLVARSTMQMATNADLRCLSVASFATYQSAGSPLRLSGDSPDNRSGGAVRFNVSQRAGCEGARESLGSHAASLNEGW